MIKNKMFINYICIFYDTLLIPMQHIIVENMVNIDLMYTYIQRQHSKLYKINIHIHKLTVHALEDMYYTHHNYINY